MVIARAGRWDAEDRKEQAEMGGAKIFAHVPVWATVLEKGEETAESDLSQISTNFSK